MKLALASIAFAAFAAVYAPAIYNSLFVTMAQITAVMP